MIDLGIKIHMIEVETDHEKMGPAEHVVYDVVEPGSGYLVERFDDLMAAIRWAAVPMCQRVMYGYPHPGCAEFAPPDEIPCGHEATRRVTYNDGWLEAAGDDPFTVEYLCDRCVSETYDAAADPVNGLPVSDLSDGPLPVRETAEREMSS